MSRYLIGIDLQHASRGGRIDVHLFPGLLLLLFLLDIFLAVPFGGASYIVDGAGILACGVVLYLAYDAFLDLR